MKRILMVLTIFTLLVSTINFGRARAESLPVFKDISKHWAEKSIIQAVKSGYVSGYPDQTFKPDQKVTRAEFIKLIVTSMKLSVTEGTYNNWFDPYVKAASAAGVYMNGDFIKGDFNTPMNRYELSRVAARSIDQKNAGNNEWMYIATKNGLIQGMDNTGNLGETLPTTRAQSITVIERILSTRAGESLKVDKHAVNRAEVIWHGTNAFSMMEYAIGKDDPRWDQIQATLKTFNPANMTIETPAGLPKVKKVIDALLFIDLDDPQDPYRHLIPNNARIMTLFEGEGKTFYLRDYKNAFAIVSKGSVLINDDKKAYPGNDKIFITVNSGVNIDLERLAKGDITNQGSLPLYFDHIGEANDARIIAKDFKYFPTFESYITAKPPTQTYKKNIFTLKLVN